MANLAKIQSIAQGQFFVKDSLGNLVELKVGDTVSLNDIIVAASSNTDLSKIEILFDTNELIILSQGEQLLDATLLASTFGNEELAFDKQEVDETLNAWNNAQDGDATDMETAAGDVTEQATNAGDERAADGGALRSKFNSRDGDATDIVSDLREASWTDGIERTIEDSENMLLEQPLPIVYTIIEGIDVVNEGDSANYVVKLQDAAGNPVIATQDTIIYVRYTNKTTQDGDTQYNNENIIEVVIKAGTSQTEFTIKTNDDYLADNGEIYNVSITGNNSTEFDMRTGDVAGNKTNVDTEILDNTTTNPNEDSNVESDMEQVVLKIVAADENGKPIKDVNGEYLTVNEVPEGDTAYYVVLAFEPNTTKFNDNTKLDVQSGTVEVKTFDKDATGTTTQTKEDGTQDYVSKTQKVELGKVISVETLDDWKADNGEQYEIKITDKSYEHPTTGAVYENVVTDKDPITTTIKDNTTTNPNNPSTIENNQENVILKIVAVDKDGNPLFEVDGKTFKTTSEVVEGDSAYYKVFAFAPDSKEFNTDTKLPDILQRGTVTVKTGDIGAIGVQSQTANDGSQDYISKTQSDIKVGETIFTVKTIDDYKAETETNETFKVEIENGSYKHPNNDGKDAIYENVTIDPTVATTIIVDNNSTKNADVVVGGSDTNSTTYGAEDTVYAVITANKSSVAEGEVVTYTVKLVDYKGNEVKVSNPTDVTIKFSGSTTNPADLKDLLKINGIEVTDTTKDTFTIEIPKDESSINFTIETKDDAYTEGKESYTLKIEDVNTEEFENIKFNEYTGLDTTKVPNPSNTTTTEINDNSTEVKIVLVAVGSATTTIGDITDSNGKLIYEDKNITPESGKLYYVAVAVDKDNNVLIQDGKVKVSTYDVADGAKGGNSVKPPLDGSEDYQSLKDKEVSLGEVFDVQTNDDYVRDNNETFTVKIDSIVDGSKYENPSVDTTKDTVTSTIKDNVPVKNHQVDNIGGIDGTVYGKEDTVYVKIEGNPTVVEGGEVEYTVKLVDSTGKEVKVTSDTKVTVTFGTNNSVSDGEVELKGTPNNNPLENGKNITITIPKNGNSASFTIKTKDDFTADNNETFNLKITDIDSKEFENIVYDDNNGINTTIKDGVTLGDPVGTKVYEDGLNDSSDKTENSLANSLGITNPNNDAYTVSFDKTITTTTEKSNGQTITYSYNESGTILTAKRTDGKVVFTVELKKDASGKDVYDFQLKEAMDHEYGNNGKNDFDLPFKFNVTSNGTSSDYKTFKVTVVDSVPNADDKTVTTNEDTEIVIRLSNEAFKDGTIKINGTDVVKDASIAIYEKGDTTKEIGTLINNGDGTVKFTPSPDYSNYDFTKSPQFTYTVTDFDGDEATATVTVNVKPVADAPTVNVKDVTTYEDASKYDDKDTGNKAEGQNKIPLGLIVPSLSKDQTDKNNATGDAPERNGEITLSFTNSTLVTGAELYNGNTKVADITENDQVVEIVIVKTSGGIDIDIDTDYHHKGTLPAKGGNVLYLTKAEYEGLKIQHSEDNDTDIKITINVTSYEVDDSGKPLTGDLATSSTTTADMTVIIKPVTDDIELTFDNATVNGEVLGTIDGKTFVFKNDVIKENGEINFKQLLTNTSGTTDGTNGTEKGDLDGSEIRWYTVKFEGDSKDHPDYLIINGKTVSLSNGEYKYEFTINENKQADPDFKVQFPNGYSGGTLKGELTLHVQDRGVEEKSDPTKWGDELKQTVKFEVAVNPVADEATLKVGQVVGYEDTARNTNKNIQDKDGTIKHPENGIKLPIEVTSTDTDGSETFTVTIKDIPNGGAIFVKEPPLTGKDILVTYAEDGTPTIKVWNNGILEDYNGTAIKAEKGSITIEKYDNANPPKFIPPHNEHGDFKLNVDAKTVDTVKINGVDKTHTQEVATSKEIVVVVKDVADSVVGNEYNKINLVDEKIGGVANPNYDSKYKGTKKDYNAVVNEDDNGGKISLNSIFTDSTKLSSYDKESEDLTIVIKSLPDGVTLEGKNVTLIGEKYIFKAEDIKGINIVTPPNYSGELNFDIQYITTERGEFDPKEIASKTFDSNDDTKDPVSIFVKPTVDAVFNSKTEKAEDIDATTIGDKSFYQLNLGISHQNVDTDETLVSVTIDKPTDGDFKLFIKNSDGSFSEITDFTKTYTEAELKNIYVQAPENQHGNFDIIGTYTVKDSQYGSKDVNYETVKTDTFKHTLTITPVTDKPTITVEDGVQTKIEVISGEAKTIEIPIKVTSVDKDGSENITKIVISGVPQGVTISFGDAELDAKVTVSEHNGIYTIIPKDGNYKLNDADFKNITFNVTSGANFEHRNITITAYTQDATGSNEESTSTKITLDKTHNGTGGGTGSAIGIELKDGNPYQATEDTEFNFLDVFKVVVADGGSDGKVTLNFALDSTNATIKGLTPNANGSYTITGNRADIESVLSSLKVVPNKDYNNNHTTDKGTLDITITIDGKTPITAEVPVTPVTDSLNVEITANDNTTIDENGEFNFDIKLTNNSDKEFTIINDFYVVIDEKFEAGENAKGELYLGNTKLELVDGKYKLPADYKLGDSLNLTYKSGEDRNGTVEIKVVAVNKETGATNELTSAGSTTITVKPVVSSVIVQKVQDGIEDGQMASVKLNITKADASERFESVLIKVASGVAVYYDKGTKLAMNLGGGSWLIPVSGDGKTLPEILFKGKEHLGGEIEFTATINAKDGEAKVTKELTGSVTITEVADGVTIDPTKTGIDKNAFEWTTLNLNANMKDLDGSEKMYLELKGLGAFAQFKLKDGGIVESEYDSVNKVWTIKDIAYDKINDIQFTNDKDTTVDIKAWTTDGIDSTREKPATGSMEVDFAKNAVENGKFTLGKEVNIDFSKIVNGDIQGVNKIDLSAEGENKLLNLTLEDVLSIGTKDVKGNINLTILGDSDDKVTFKNEIGKEWSSNVVNDDKGNKLYTEWSNTTGDTTVTVKVEQPISDGITN